MSYKNDKRLPETGSEADVRQLVTMAQEAFSQYSLLSLSRRREIISAIKEQLKPMIPGLAELEFQEMKMGNVRDKIVKIYLALSKTPGVEDLVTEASTGDHGMTLYEYCAYGIVCTVLPGTNPCATLICNTIGMIAAGNSVIHIPNPRCEEVTRFLAQQIDKIIYDVCGIRNLVAALPHSSMQQAEEIMNHPDISLVVATGGPRMLRTALGCCKRVIGAGQANPVVIVDKTADLVKAAKDIVEGASFDNNIMCVSEKNLVVEAPAADELVREMEKLGTHYIKDEQEMLQLTKVIVSSGFSMNRAMEGKSAAAILDEAGIPHKPDVRLVLVDTMITHPLFTEEFLMPVVSMLRVDDFEEALKSALFIEQGNHHTAMIHSQSISNLNRAAHELQTAVFIKNGSSLDAIGMYGEEATSFTIANITGEGVTTARHFARRRRCSLTTGFSIR